MKQSTVAGEVGCDEDGLLRGYFPLDHLSWALITLLLPYDYPNRLDCRWWSPYIEEEARVICRRSG
ncbi:MAG: hypothetical protein GX369_08225 [Euryarchaeota archaeon]|nr:hypothetical protein [Euryarchaeota archaeon]